jgi:myo-inositol-1(or 4)-monophosphatase
MQISSIELMRHAEGAATLAGALLASNFGQVHVVSSKSQRHDLVTEMDVKAEHAIVDYLRERTPSCAFLGEELGSVDGASGLSWVVDPLDGTVNYAHNIPLYCVSVAAVINDIVVAGAIHAPTLGETWTAFRDGGAFLNGNRIAVSKTASLQDAMLVTGFPYNVEENPGNCHNHFVSMLKRGLPIRRLGSAALDLAWTAAGRFDGFWEVSLKPWDVAAGSLIVQEAGGRISHYNDQEFNLANESIIATNGLIHSDLVSALSVVKDSL